MSDSASLLDIANIEWEDIYNKEGVLPILAITYSSLDMPSATREGLNTISQSLLDFVEPENYIHRPLEEFEADSSENLDEFSVVVELAYFDSSTRTLQFSFNPKLIKSKFN